MLGRAGHARLECRHHRRHHALGGLAQVFDLLRRLARTQPLERHGRIDDVDVGETLAQHGLGVGRQEGGLHAHPADAVAELPDMGQRLLHGSRAAGVAQVECGRPEPAQFLLVGLHGAADVGRVLGLALAVDQRRQIAAGADRIHGVEEEEAVAAQQILDVVLGGGDQHVDAGVVHQPVEPAGIEGQGFASGHSLGNSHRLLLGAQFFRPV